MSIPILTGCHWQDLKICFQRNWGIDYIKYVFKLYFHVNDINIINIILNTIMSTWNILFHLILTTNLSAWLYSFNFRSEKPTVKITQFSTNGQGIISSQQTTMKEKITLPYVIFFISFLTSLFFKISFSHAGHHSITTSLLGHAPPRSAIN